VKVGLMGVGSFLYQQLGHPTGCFGRSLLRFLNWANSPMNSLAVSCLKPTDQDHVLEIGFGGGNLIKQLAQSGLPNQFTGLEISIEALHLCEKQYHPLIHQGRVHLHTTQASTLPFASGQFNKICSINALYFWPNPVDILAECKRVLSPNGILYLCYNTKDLLDLYGFSHIGLRGYTVTQIETLFLEAGFGSIQTTSARSLRNGSFYCSYGFAS
jgi:ubiquinone/menaquinone biosynthesis C-methylase UbiE